MEEFGPPQQPGQPAGVIHQPAVVIVPQGAKQPAYQPVAHPGQQPLQYPGQQQPVVMMGTGTTATSISGTTTACGNDGNASTGLQSTITTMGKPEISQLNHYAL